MKSLIVANWKMNPATLKRAKGIFNPVKKKIKNFKNAEVVFCPPFVYLPVLIGLSSVHQKMSFGGQSCFWEQEGAFTGEISAKMLKNLGCQYVIIGHSEKRRRLQESDQMINKKIKAAVGNGLKPIFCVGETQKQRKKGETLKILGHQIKSGLAKVSKKEIKNVIIAYEPVWAIGTGKSCPVDEAKTKGTYIKKIIARLYGAFASESLRLLYGGSVNSKNAEEFIKKGKFQGLLIGGASLKPKEFVKIIKIINS